MSTDTIADYIREEYLNQPLAILCARYWYRGIVSQVGSDFIVLSYPRAVEVTGPSRGSKPQTEDPIPSDLMITIGSIEQICQPFWCWDGIEDIIQPPKEIKTMTDEEKKKEKSK